MSQNQNNGKQHVFDSSSRRLYYELGYQPTVNSHKTIAIQNDMISYLIVITALLIFVFGLSVWITLILLVILYLAKNYLGEALTKNMELSSLGIIFIVYLLEHISIEVIVLPGELIAENISILAWIIEIIWIVLFSLQLLLLNQPETSQILAGKTVTPITEESMYSYSNLIERLRSGTYEVRDHSETIDTELLRVSFTSLLKFLFGIMLTIIIIDTIIWQFINTIAGGNNLNEIYIVSGMAFILYLLLLFISSWITDK